MNALKTLVVAVILAGCVYGCIQLIYKPGASEVVDDWKSALNITPGEPSSDPAPQWNSETPSTPAAPLFAGNTPPSGLNISMPDDTSTPSANGSAPRSHTPAANSTTDPTAGLVLPAGATTEPTPVNPSAPLGGNNGLYSPSTPSAVTPMDPSAAMGQPSGNQFNPGVPNPTDSGLARNGETPSMDGLLSKPNEDHGAFMIRVFDTLAANRLAEAHLMLSERYIDPKTTPQEAQSMQQLLDQLAGTVVYSPKSLLDAPYEVLATDTLQTIADRYNVPTGLLLKINGLQSEADLKTGQRIKVIRGPFHAVIDLSDQELTLLLDGKRYAGRFPVAIGPDVRQEGVFYVTDKDPARWHGTRWIGLGERMGLHQADGPITLGQPMREGFLGFNQKDIEDLYDILSVGSTITIRQ